ncbi:MAG: AAA family ATPase [Pseudanabaena sp.]|jgi:predicted ATPase
MQIHRLALKNFKCFKEVDISFSKITLLTGENSSGKSSLIYGILAPLQSVNFNGNSFPLYLSLNGNYVNMGGCEEVLFNHDFKNDIEINLNFSFGKNVYDFTTLWSFDTIRKSPRLKYLKDGSEIELKQKEDLSYIVNIRDNNQQLKTLNINDLDSDIEVYNYFMCSTNDRYRDLIKDFNFISSFRFQPERTYYQSLSSGVINKFGDGYIDQILDWNDNQSEELYKLTAILKDLRMLHDVKLHRLSGGRFEIKVKVKSRSKWESLADVGFGISQFLPIIVADLQLRDNSTLIMSQPEIHLHPSVQANLGDYLVKQVKERNKNYIVETHSEYLLNRMRLLIVKGEIKPEDVAVYYFENSIKDGSIAHRIEFTKDGQILNAPKGFFETYMIDTMDIALNA